ncbi:MAG: hypothetical protein BGO98_48445 [Myxococcales bacterium 68-20]|nr:MAG: hypothetical protein BGO98_48445 [Myxococcales bacterium 68-20]
MRQKAVAVALLTLVGLAAIVALRSRPADDGARSTTETTAPNAKDPRLVLGRAWFDRYPGSRSDEVDLWWFSSAGIGIHDRGSVWRSTMDFFDFERQSSKVELMFLHDKKKELVRFEVVACEDEPPFDLCLDLKEPLRGKKRLYSFAFEDEMDAHVPWARAWRASAEARSRAVR